MQFSAIVNRFIEEEEVYLPRHRFVKARGHPPQTLQKYRIAFSTSHKAPEQIHKLLKSQASHFISFPQLA